VVAVGQIQAERMGTYGQHRILTGGSPHLPTAVWSPNTSAPKGDRPPNSACRLRQTLAWWLAPPWSVSPLKSGNCNATDVLEVRESFATARKGKLGDATRKRNPFRSERISGTGARAAQLQPVAALENVALLA